MISGAHKGRVVGHCSTVPVDVKVVDRLEKGDRVGDDEKAKVDGKRRLGQLWLREDDEGEQVAGKAEHHDDRIVPQYDVDYGLIIHFSDTIKKLNLFFAGFIFESKMYIPLCFVRLSPPHTKLFLFKEKEKTKISKKLA